jgi:hypothetical protein
MRVMAVKLSHVLWPKKTSDKSADTFTSAEHLPVDRIAHSTHTHAEQVDSAQQAYYGHAA